MRVTVGDTIAPYVTVALDGVDVASECTEADSVLGYVETLDTDEDGHLVVVSGDPLKSRKRGKVEIALRADAPENIRLAFDLLKAADGMTALVRKFVELSAYADALRDGLRAFRETVLMHGVDPQEEESK